MKTTTKIATAVAILGLVGVFALTGAFAHGTQTNAAGWQGMNGMMNNQAGAPVNSNQGYYCYGQPGTTVGDLNGSSGYCYAHNVKYNYDAQTGAWNCPYGCVYGGQAQGASEQSSGHADNWCC